MLCNTGELLVLSINNISFCCSAPSCCCCSGCLLKIDFDTKKFVRKVLATCKRAGKLAAKWTPLQGNGNAHKLGKKRQTDRGGEGKGGREGKLNKINKKQSIKHEELLANVTNMMRRRRGEALRHAPNRRNGKLLCRLHAHYQVQVAARRP